MVTLPRSSSVPISNEGAEGKGVMQSKFDNVDPSLANNLRWCRGTPHGIGAEAGYDGGGGSGSRGSQRERRQDTSAHDAYFDHRKLESMQMDVLGIDYHEPILMEVRSVDGMWLRDRFREPKDFRSFELGGECNISSRPDSPPPDMRCTPVVPATCATHTNKHNPTA